MSDRFLLDNSAWARLSHAALPPTAREHVAALFDRQRIAACLPFLLEAGYSAQNARDHDQLFSALLDLPRVAIDGPTEARALEAQRQLARIGHHRIPPVDLIIAAAADRHGFGVLHYDRDYDLLRERTDLDFASSWLTERGSL